MKKLSKAKIQEHAAVIKIALDDKSPFKDKVDLKYLLKLPTEQQWQIFRALPKDIQQKFSDHWS